MKRLGTGLLLGAALCATALAAGEPDWFTRVKANGLEKACEVEVARHARGVLADSHHVGECYYRLERWEEGVSVFKRLLRSRDRNYAAAALARMGEGQYHLGRLQEARKTFRRCLEEHRDAWFDGSVAVRCRAWLDKLDGKLATKEPEAREPGREAELEALRKEVRDLTERLAELKALIERLSK